MAKIDSLEKILGEDIKDIYNAENQILKALPKMLKKASSPTLKSAFESHLKETQAQIERLEEIGQLLGIKLTGKVCKAMKGIIEEGSEIMNEKVDNPALLDAMLIGAAQKVEHYEISAYGTIQAVAEKLGLTEIVQLLQESLDEESATDEKLSEISENEVLNSAASYDDESEYEEAEDEEKRLSAH